MASGTEPSIWLSGIGAIVSAVGGIVAFLSRQTKEDSESLVENEKRITALETTMQVELRNLKEDIREIFRRLWRQDRDIESD